MIALTENIPHVEKSCFLNISQTGYWYADVPPAI